MSRITNNRLMVTLRLLVAVGCLVPFIGPRQVAATFGFAPAVPLGGQLPSAPMNEEEDEKEREESAKEVANLRHDRHTNRPNSDPHQFATNLGAHSRSRNPVWRPSPADPFRNGLGTHYRC